jgi:hypothetical protein
MSASMGLNLLKTIGRAATAAALLAAAPAGQNHVEGKRLRLGMDERSQAAWQASDQTTGLSNLEVKSMFSGWNNPFSQSGAYPWTPRPLLPEETNPSQVLLISNHANHCQSSIQ